ncbi:hypothetical protein [Longitalea luteola]|uniref:hypothetical protein n=1 Tax=Longitalea luteola TaxID=2812563 RepID=UPI001A9578F6|nr:hypothetical protein [Longitalea luteola]
MMQTELLTKNRNIATIGEEITPEQGAEFVNNYRKAHPNDVKAYIIGKDILTQILAQPGCAGIHFYNAVNEFGQKTLVYVGLDQDGKEMVNYTVVTANAEIKKEKGIVADRSIPTPGGGDIFGDDGWFYID